MTILILGTLAMAPVLLLCNKYYRIPLPKLLAVLVLLTITGVAGCKIMAVLEGGVWQGQSFFGAILITPWMMCLVAIILKIPVRTVLDLYGPPVCIMLVLQKVGCYRSGCCGGRTIGYTPEGASIFFPSQIVEGCMAFLICVFLCLLIRKEKYRGRIFPIFLITYGVTRFVLNLARDTEPVLWNLPFGNIWAAVSTLLGLILLAVFSRKATPDTSFSQNG